MITHTVVVKVKLLSDVKHQFLLGVNQLLVTKLVTKKLNQTNLLFVVAKINNKYKFNIIRF